MPAYDATRFTPPAPVVLVTLRDPSSGGSVSDVPMLVDTGADVTLVPLQIVNRLSFSIDPGAIYELVGFDGSPSSAQAIRAELRFLRRIFSGRFLVIDQECGILGRNILNHVSLLFDGPNLAWSEPGSPQ